VPDQGASVGKTGGQRDLEQADGGVQEAKDKTCSIENSEQHGKRERGWSTPKKGTEESLTLSLHTAVGPAVCSKRSHLTRRHFLMGRGMPKSHAQRKNGSLTLKAT